MPGSSGTFSGAVPGLSLRAWALVDGASGSLLRGFNVSASVRNSVGNYTLTLAAAMANTQVMLKLEAEAGNGYPVVPVAGALAVGSVPFTTRNNGALVDPGRFWLGVYG